MYAATCFLMGVGRWMSWSAESTHSEAVSLTLIREAHFLGRRFAIEWLAIQDSKQRNVEWQPDFWFQKMSLLSASFWKRFPSAKESSSIDHQLLPQQSNRRFDFSRLLRFQFLHLFSMRKWAPFPQESMWRCQLDTFFLWFLRLRARVFETFGTWSVTVCVETTNGHFRTIEMKVRTASGAI